MEHSKKPTFNVEDIHNLRVETGNKYRGMEKAAVEADIALHASNALETIKKMRNKQKEDGPLINEK